MSRDRRRAEAVLGKHPGHARAVRELHHQQVLAAGLAYAGLGDAQAHPLDGQQRGGIRRLEIDGHGRGARQKMTREL